MQLVSIFVSLTWYQLCYSFLFSVLMCASVIVEEWLLHISLCERSGIIILYLLFHAAFLSRETSSAGR